MGKNELPPQFSPLRRPPTRARVAVLLAGPLLWLASLIVVGFVVGQGHASGAGLLIVTISIAVSIPVMLLSRRRRVRDEAKAERVDAG